jgi:hypothetical protein
VLTVLVALGGSVVAADGVSNDRERETRERGYCYSLLPCFPSFSSVVFFFLSCSSLFVCLPSVSTFFPSLLSLLFPSLSFLFFPLFFRQLKSSPLCSSPLFSFLVCFCFFKTISLLCFFVSFLPYNLLKIFSPVSFFSKPPPSFPFSLLAFIGKRRERGLLPLSSHGIYREKEEDPLSGDLL